MLKVTDRTPAPGKEGRVKITLDDGSTVEGILEMADNAGGSGTPWNKQAGNLLQADRRSYPIAAGQSIVAGDVVDVVGGNVQRTATPVANVENVIESSAVLATAVCQLNDAYSIMTYSYSTTLIKTLIDNTTGALVGSKYGGGNTTYSNLSNIRLSDTKFASAYVANGSLNVTIGTVSGTTITAQDTSPFGSATYNALIPLSDTSFLAVYNRSGLKAKVCTVSGTTITQGAEVALAGSTSAEYISATRLPDLSGNKRVCVCFSEGNKGKAVIASIDSANSVTWGTAVEFFAHAAYETSCCTDGNCVVVSFAYNNTPGGVFAKVLSVNGIVIDGSAGELTLTTKPSTHHEVGAVGNILVAVYDRHAVCLKRNGTTLIAKTSYKFNTDEARYLSAASISSTQLILAYCDPGNSLYGTATILEVFGNQIAGSFTDESKDAIALQSGTEGQTIEVIYDGVAELAGLTAGTKITSAGVYGVGVLDGVLQVWGKDRPKGFVTGSYVGTGISGISTPTSITFPFTPTFIVLTSTGAPAASTRTLNPTPIMVFYGSKSAYSSLPSSSPGSIVLTLTWSGNTVSWYTSTKPASADDGAIQYNYTGNIYKWIAFI